MITIDLEGGYAIAHGPFPMSFLAYVARLTGRKIWNKSKSLKFEASTSNIKVFRNSNLEIKWNDQTNELADIDELEKMATQQSPINIQLNKTYMPGETLFQHQNKALVLSLDRKAYGLFFEMGLGKSATVIANFGILFKENKITGVLIVAPKGVHSQWIREQIPIHLDKSIKKNMTLWERGEEYENDDFFEIGSLNVFAINYDSLSTEKGEAAVLQFIGLHKGKLFMVCDESHNIKDYGSNRTKACIKFGRGATYKRALTGTPIAKSLEDAWSQFMFLDPRIIGIYYETAFRAKYSEKVGEYGKRDRNVEEFYSIIAPHCFRITKTECLDLPEKIFSKVPHILDKESKKHYENIKNAFMTGLKSGEIVAPQNALAALVRLQQINSGFLPREDGTIEIISYDRAKIALDICEQVNGPVIIWARFINDLVMLREVFKKHKDQICDIRNITEFQEGKKKFAFLNPASGGTGLNLQTSGCQTMIYYSNSFNSIHRWQSQDRVHRIGMKGTLTIFDIIAEKTCDKLILKNLDEKKSLSDLALDEIRQIIEAN